MSATVSEAARAAWRDIAYLVPVRPNGVVADQVIERIQAAIDVAVDVAVAHQRAERASLFAAERQQHEREIAELTAVLWEVVEARNASTRGLKAAIMKACPSWVRKVRALLARHQTKVSR